jgi:hypothetical protein
MGGNAKAEYTSSRHTVHITNGGLKDVRKYRVWCSEHDDHAGAVNSWSGKLRMEFYPDQLPSEMIEVFENSGNLEV